MKNRMEIAEISSFKIFLWTLQLPMLWRKRSIQMSAAGAFDNKKAHSVRMVCVTKSHLEKNIQFRAPLGFVELPVDLIHFNRNIFNVQTYHT